MAAANLRETISDDLNYEMWAPIMKTTLVEQKLWDVVENGVSPDPSKIPELAATIQAEDLSKWRDLARKDMKALQVLQSSLPDPAFRKTLAASSAKDVWDLLEKGNEEAKLLGLEKRFEELSMYEGEAMDSYVDRVLEVVEQFRGLKNAKPDYEVITKVLGSLSMSYERVAPLIDEYMDLENMSLAEFHEIFGTFGSLTGVGLALMLKDTFDSPKWGSDVCSKKKNHNQEERYSIPRAGNSSGAKKDQYREVEAEYEMLALTIGDFTYDEDMWMVYTTTSNHMTPYVKFFTTLDRTHRARVKLANGSIIMTEGRGDVRIMTKEGKKTIKNVLYVPAINRNVLSVYQMTSMGYSVIMAGNKRFRFTIKDQNGKLFGETNWDNRGYYYLRFQVIEGHLTS